MMYYIYNNCGKVEISILPPYVVKDGRKTYFWKYIGCWNNFTAALMASEIYMDYLHPQE